MTGRSDLSNIEKVKVAFMIAIPFSVVAILLLFCARFIKYMLRFELKQWLFYVIYGLISSHYVFAAYLALLNPITIGVPFAAVLVVYLLRVIYIRKAVNKCDREIVGGLNGGFWLEYCKKESDYNSLHCKRFWNFTAVVYASAAVLTGTIAVFLEKPIYVFPFKICTHSFCGIKPEYLLCQHAINTGAVVGLLLDVITVSLVLVRFKLATRKFRELQLKRLLNNSGDDRCCIPENQGLEKQVKLVDGLCSEIGVRFTPSYEERIQGFINQNKESLLTSFAPLKQEISRVESVIAEDCENLEKTRMARAKIRLYYYDDLLPMTDASPILKDSALGSFNKLEDPQFAGLIMNRQWNEAHAYLEMIKNELQSIFERAKNANHDQEKQRQEQNRHRNNHSKSSSVSRRNKMTLEEAVSELELPNDYTHADVKRQFKNLVKDYNIDQHQDKEQHILNLIGDKHRRINSAKEILDVEFNK